MNFEEVKKLTEQGFTMEQIEIINSMMKQKQKPEQKQKPKPEQKPKQEPEQKPKQEPENNSDVNLEKLAQLLNLKNTNIDVPPEVTIDEKMSDHFLDLLGVKNKKENKNG